MLDGSRAAVIRRIVVLLAETLFVSVARAQQPPALPPPAVPPNRFDGFDSDDFKLQISFKYKFSAEIAGAQ
jgi:hypothetical protein